METHTHTHTAAIIIHLFPMLALVGWVDKSKQGQGLHQLPRLDALSNAIHFTDCTGCFLHFLITCAVYKTPAQHHHCFLYGIITSTFYVAPVPQYQCTLQSTVVLGYQFCYRGQIFLSAAMYHMSWYFVIFFVGLSILALAFHVLYHTSSWIASSTTSICFKHMVLL